MAPVLGGLAGLIAGSQAPAWGWPTAWAGIGILVMGLLSLPALTDQQELAAAALADGFILAVSGTVIALTGADAGIVLALVVALAATGSIGVPWLALASTPLRVVTPRSDAEIFADPPQVQAAQVQRQLAAGHRVQVALRVAIGVLAIAAAPAVVSTGVAGTVMLVLAFGGMLLATRQTYSRTDVLLTVTLSVIGLGETLLIAAAAHPAWQAALIGVAGAGAAVVVALSLIAPRQRLALTRMGDFLEVACLAVLLPLGVAAAGLA